MKRQVHLFLSGLTLAVSFTAHGQSTFQNLGFEAAHALPQQNGFVAASNALPGWTVYLGTNQSPDVFCTGVSLGGALVSLISRATSGWSNAVIAGNYTAVLSAGFDFATLSHPGVAIAQSSLVPASAQSLRFRLGYGSVVSDFSVAFNGSAIPFFALASGQNFTVYGGDISAFAGVTGELRFTESPLTSPFSTAYLDGIEFSPEPIPEPGALWLLLGGLSFIGFWRWRKIH